MKIFYFDYQINKPFSLLDMHIVLWSREHDVLRAQRIMGFLS